MRLYRLCKDFKHLVGQQKNKYQFILQASTKQCADLLTILIKGLKKTKWRSVFIIVRQNAAGTNHHAPFRVKDDTILMEAVIILA